MDPDEPGGWLNSFVCVRKSNGKIRLCQAQCLDSGYSLAKASRGRALYDHKLHKQLLNVKLTYNSFLFMAFGMIFCRYHHV